ncbi:MAG: hypothetical protein PHH23_06700 [Paludibacteraceae bacterium]|nr:hypothetical protein [Paludibacteraceae bacterium]
MDKIGAIKVDDAAIQKALMGKAEGASYIGAGDNMLEFGSASSFVNENKTGRRFQFTLKNIDATDAVKVNLNPAVAAATYNDLAEGVVVTNKLTAAGSPRSIAVLLAYIKNNPTRIQSIKLKVDNAAQLDNPMIFRHETPFGSFVEEQRVPSDYQNQTDNRDTIAEIDDIQEKMLSDMDTILYEVQAGRTVQVSVLFGASLDGANALSKKAKEAAENVSIAYARSAASK